MMGLVRYVDPDNPEHSVIIPRDPVKQKVEDNPWTTWVNEQPLTFTTAGYITPISRHPQG